MTHVGPILGNMFGVAAGLPAIWGLQGSGGAFSSCSDRLECLGFGLFHLIAAPISPFVSLGAAFLIPGIACHIVWNDPERLQTKSQYTSDVKEFWAIEGAAIGGIVAFPVLHSIAAIRGLLGFAIHPRIYKTRQ
jgi:hypothetical protein